MDSIQIDACENALLLLSMIYSRKLELFISIIDTKPKKKSEGASFSFKFQLMSIVANTIAHFITLKASSFHNIDPSSGFRSLNPITTSLPPADDNDDDKVKCENSLKLSSHFHHQYQLPLQITKDPTWWRVREIETIWELWISICRDGENQWIIWVESVWLFRST